MISSTISRIFALERLRVFLRLALRVDVHERLVGVGQDLRPAALVEDLDAVHQVELLVTQPLSQDAHDHALHRPRTRELAVDEGRRGRSATSSDKGFRTGASSSISLQRLATAS